MLRYRSLLEESLDIFGSRLVIRDVNINTLQDVYTLNYELRVTKHLCINNFCSYSFGILIFVHAVYLSMSNVMSCSMSQNGLQDYMCSGALD